MGKMPKELLEYFKKKQAKEAMYGAKLAEAGMKVLKDYGMGGKYYKDSGKNGEIPGLDVKSKPVMIGFDVEAQKPIMDTAQQIYIDGLPVSGREAAAFINEKSEGMEGQGGVSVPDALMAAQQRRTREMSGRDYLGGNMFRTTAEEELQRAQKAAGTNALLKRLQEYNGNGRTRSY